AGGRSGGEMRGSGAAVTIVVAVAFIAALAGSAFWFLRASDARDESSRGAAAIDAASSAPGEASTRPKRSDTSADHASLAPTVTAIEPRLEWPDEASLRKLEEGGRALFGGVVRAPDGTPCEGALGWV